MKAQNLQSSLQPLLLPISKMYSLAMKVRRSMYKMHLLSQYHAQQPTISVGNISWGGTGKTPVVDYLTGWALQKALKPVILTRGYGGKLPYTPLHINPAHSAQEVGDEPLMLSQSHPLAAVLVDPNRTRAATYAAETFKPDLFILDDGFQHLAIDRHLDLVLLTHGDLGSEWNNIIPAGSWREPPSALKSADAYLFKTTRSEWADLSQAFLKRIGDHVKPLFGFILQPIGLVPVVGDYYAFPASILDDSPFAFVSGIGNPSQAKASLTRFMSRLPDVTHIFPDHHDYTIQNANMIMELKMPVICTHKDAVKLAKYNIPNLWYLKVQPFFGSSLGTKLSFDQWLETWWAKQNKESPSKDKTLLTWDVTASYEGGSLKWGENLTVTYNPEVHTLPTGWGPLISEEEKEKKIEFPVAFLPDPPEPPKTQTKQSPEKDSTAYLYLLEENKKKLEAMQKVSGTDKDNKEKKEHNE